MWITSTEYRKKYNITPQHLYALKKSGKITFKPYVGKEVLILDENDLNDDKLNCVYARITSKESEDVLNEQITYIKKYMVSNGFNPDEVYSDVASGYSFDRDGIRNLIDAVISGTIKNVFITDESRVSVNDFSIVERIFEKFGTKIKKINIEDKKYLSNVNDEDLNDFSKNNK